MLDALQFEFMRNAVAAGILASIICGLMGTLVVVNRIVFLSGGIAHAAYGGIGMAFFFGWPYLMGTIGFTLAAGMTMAGVSYRMKHRSDSVIGVIWAVGMALGIVFLDLTPGYNVDLMSYLFGSILAVPASDLWIMGGVAAVVAGFISFYYQDLLAMSYDEEFARIRGVRVRRLYFLLIAMLSVGVVMIIQVVGLILVIAMLTIPPLMVEPHAKSLFQMMAGASAASAVFTVTGLWLSYTFDLTSGATIILVAGTAFLVQLLLRALIKPGPESSAGST
ncbi:MAG: metal ABC transporter permease [Desulfobacterales bacterium]